MLAFSLTSQIVYLGVIDGLLIGLLALGIVLIYRASGVINFAVGSLGVLSASLLALLVLTYGWPFWPAAVISVVAGGLVAAALELTVITRLFRAPRVILLVATIGIAQLCELLQVALPDIDTSLSNRYPVALSGQWEILGLRVRGVELIVIIVVPALTVALTYYLQRTLPKDGQFGPRPPTPTWPGSPPSARRSSRPSRGSSRACWRRWR